MSAESITKCTVVIFHREETKSTLYDILKRMNCEICEVSSLEDLLNHIQSSEQTIIQFASTTDEESYSFLQSHDDFLLRGKKKSLSSTSADRPKSLQKGSTSHHAYNNLTLDEIEKIHITNTLRACNWIIKTAAKSLGIDRTTLYRKINKYGITRE